MIQGAAYVVFYGIIAAVVSCAATFMSSAHRNLTNGIAYLTGFVLGTTIVRIISLLLGQAAADA